MIDRVVIDLDTTCLSNDIAATLLRPLHQWVTESGLPEVLTEAGSSITYWHVMDDSKDSLTTLGSLLAAFGASIRYVIVLNHGRGNSFMEVAVSPDLAHAKALGSTILTLPKLHDVSMHKIDNADVSFWAAVNRTGNGDATLGMLERHLVRVWLKTFSAELDKVLAPT